MKESISNSYVFMIVITIIGLCSIIVISSLSYSKTFKIKNRMIETIEKYGTFNSEVEAEIDELLRQTGYPYAENGDTCPKGRGNEELDDGSYEVGYTAINTVKNYKYCIYQYDTIKGTYYSVVTYMTFELPLIGDFIKIELPMYGDTKIFSDI